MIAIVYCTNQLLCRLNLCIYRMCNVRFGIRVHSCEQVSGIDGENEIYLLFLFFYFSFFFFFFSFSRSLALSLSLPPSLSFTSEEEKEFEILSHSRTHTHIHALLAALLPIYLLSTAHRPMKFQNRRVKRAEKTTATTIERRRRRKKTRDGE